MAFTTRQVIAMRNIAHSLKAFYSDCDSKVTDFISPGWIAVIEDSTALICEICNGEGQVGGLTPEGYDCTECDACDGSGLKLEQRT
ncbi:hypothetical protein [Pseudomonas siliginis]|uniref:hypothetical protein n=1 Tax=Pseudomonas siliginis TaxID=2842346 RepID=UPI00209219BC|nr:hypothetical protein [Pseudomonas siliginis]UST97752.1 hypothetical protein NF679_11810 [Pseudomonas siliginis]